MELTPIERLEVHLLLHYPKLKLQHVRLSPTSGFLHTPLGTIDIRGVSYSPNNPPLRLWNELHYYYSQHVDVIKRKHGQPTLIVWNGMVFHLDQTRTYQRQFSQPRGLRRKRQRNSQTILEGG